MWQLEGDGEEEATLGRLRGDSKDASDGASNPMNLDIAGAPAAAARTSWRRCARGGRPAIDGREALQALEIVLAVYRSAEAGQKVELPLIGR